MATGQDIVDAANRQLGKPYSWSIACRCSNRCERQDCSGLVCGCYNEGTGQNICTSSFGLADWLQRNGLLVPERVAIFKPGAIGIRNAWGDSSGASGSNGHVVIFTGKDINGNPTSDASKLVTTEERGTAYGCVHAPATGRGFNAWGYLPGIDMRDPLPGFHIEGEDLVYFTLLGQQPLRRGMRGPAVTWAQKLLNWHHAGLNPIGELYGQKMVDAVRRFKVAHGLPNTDGNVIGAYCAWFLLHPPTK